MDHWNALALTMLAIDTFSFLGEPESEDYAMFMQVKNSALYKPLVDHLPNSNATW